MTQVPDPDDILRTIDEENEDQRNTEVKRLLPKLRAFKSHFTASYNILANLITATRGKDNNFDRSTGTMSAQCHPIARTIWSQNFSSINFAHGQYGNLTNQSTLNIRSKSILVLILTSINANSKTHKQCI